MTMRERFASVARHLLDEDPRLAIVIAEISKDLFEQARARHPVRVINVGIREQLMIGVAGGLALTGLRPIAHSYAPFVVDRAYEQIKLDLDHQGVGAILVSVGASYDVPELGRTHFSPGDVALFDTLGDWTVHVPGHEDEVEGLLRSAARGDGRCYVRLQTRANSRPHADFEVVREGSRATVFAVGPMLDPVLDAVTGLDVAVVYVNTPRPLDPGRVRSAAGTGDVVIVEPYSAGTSAHVFAASLNSSPRRILSLGVGRKDLHRYGTPEDHDRWHGLDPLGLRRSIAEFLDVRERQVDATVRFEIFPRDIDRIVDFYTSVLQFSVDRDDRATGAPYVELARGAVRIGAVETDAHIDPGVRRPPTGVEIVIEVEDLDTEYLHVLESGWPIEGDLGTRPWGLRDFRLLDPEGHYIRVTHRRDRG